MTPLEPTIAFDKLVDVAMKQTEILTEQTMLLRDLKERIIGITELHADSVRDTRTFLTEKIDAAIGNSDMWWRRALLLTAAAVVLIQLVMGTGGSLLKLVGIGH